MEGAKHFASHEMAALDLAGTGVKAGHVAAKLAEGNVAFQKLLARGKISKVDFKDITEMNGLTSMILKCAFHFEGSGGEPFALICKIFSVQRLRALNMAMTLSQGGQEPNEASKAVGERMIAKMSRVHNRECCFYERFGQAGILPLPAIYHTQTLEGDRPGIILMEDLGDKARIHGFDNTMSKEQLENVVVHLAALSKHVLCLEDQEGWRQGLEELYFAEEMNAEMLDQMTAGILAFDREAFEVPLRRLRNAFNIEHMLYALRGCLKEIGMPELLVHGDLHCNNLMWQKRADGTLTDELVAFIDWQLIFVGNPTSDIARLLVHGCDPAQRHELEPQMLHLYHGTLSKLMAREGKKLHFTLEQVKRAYEYASIMPAAASAMIVPLFDSAWKAGKQFTEEEEREHAAKIQKLLTIAKAAVGDAVKTLERIAPDWLAD